MNDPDYIADVKQRVAAWRSQSPSIVSQLLGVAATPIGWLVHQLIPSSAIDGALFGFDWVAKMTLTAPGAKDADSLKACDRNADMVFNFHVGAATSEGAAAGFFGIFAIPPDIPAVVTIALRGRLARQWRHTRLFSR